eukprot:SAG31_NODE_2114_length_6416_cov_25.024379_4_plen_94_part_00
MAVLMAIIFDNDSGKLLGVARALEAGCRAAGAEVELYRLEATREASTKDLSGRYLLLSAGLHHNICRIYVQLILLDCITMTGLEAHNKFPSIV